MTRPKVSPAEVFYPETDGKPMAESDLHRDLMLNLISTVRHHFRQDPEVYVSGNLLVYFEEGNPKKVVAPDFFFVRGIPKGRRRIYKVWEEAKGPEVVIELTSPSTHREDLGKKRAVYERLSVQEYFIFDPEGTKFQPPFQGFYLQGGAFLPIQAMERDDGTLIFSSKVMGLELHGLEDSLRPVDPVTGQPLRFPEELAGLVEEEMRRADMERRRAEEACLRTEEERLRAEEEHLRAEQERLRADEAEARAKSVEAELARLREELDRRQE